MNPYSEKRLTEEVLHLHSLWRRGPPRNPKPIHNHSPAAANRNPTNKRSRDPTNRKPKKKKPRPEPPQDSGPEWPCPEPVQNQPSTSSGWPSIEPNATPAAHPASSEDRANLAALQLQYKGSDACRAFFARNAGSGSDEEEEEDGNDGEVIESEEYEFFLKMFVENDELRGYYEKNSEAGSFCCLVCGGMGKKKSGKRFKNCAGLVQHSISISSSKKKLAHRAFAQVVCRVFGWDIDRLPTIVLKGEPLGRSLPNSGHLKVQPEENHVAKEHGNVAISNDEDDKNDEVVSDDENEQELEEEKTVQDPTSRAEDLISAENKDACKENNDVDMQTENAGNSISGMGESKAEIKDLISGENEDACKENNDVDTQTENADNSISGIGESKAEMEILPVPESVLKACEDFFATFSTSTTDDDACENNLIDGGGLEERDEFKFFFKLFTENESLRRYYENNYNDGESFCIACDGAGKKTLKGFKTRERLLQHTSSLAKIKIEKKPDLKPHVAKRIKNRILAHRAYSLVICKVLGWDIEKLPAVVLKGEPLGRSSTM